MHSTNPPPSPYDPAAQGVHALTPDDDEYDPAAQGVQALAPDEYDPAMQGVHDSVPLDRHVPDWPPGQAGHFNMIMGEYVSPLKLYKAETSLADRLFV